jgi:hypothetical protein
MNASPVTQVGMDRPDVRKSDELFMYRASAQPMPMTNATYAIKIA